MFFRIERARRKLVNFAYYYFELGKADFEFKF